MLTSTVQLLKGNWRFSLQSSLCFLKLHGCLALFWKLDPSSNSSARMNALNVCIKVNISVLNPPGQFQVCYCSHKYIFWCTVSTLSFLHPYIRRYSHSVTLLHTHTCALSVCCSVLNRAIQYRFTVQLVAFKSMPRLSDPDPFSLSSVPLCFYGIHGIFWPLPIRRITRNEEKWMRELWFLNKINWSEL